MMNKIQFALLAIICIVIALGTGIIAYGITLIQQQLASSVIDGSVFIAGVFILAIGGPISCIAFAFAPNNKEGKN